jgi:2-oxo-4-hydroxy-4-carboxy-5-ureidoimidazoline decarboxylase
MEPWLRLDSASEADARMLLTTCCGSKRWVDRMMARRPFASGPALQMAAAEEWNMLDPSDWREAFSHHPRIGDLDSLRDRFPMTSQLSEREQADVRAASKTMLEALADANRRYEERFGYIFIVCATGKSVEEMLTLLYQRMPNDEETEIRIAAIEQQKITAIRLDGLTKQPVS